MVILEVEGKLYNAEEIEDEKEVLRQLEEIKIAEQGSILKTNQKISDLDVDINFLKARRGT